MVIEFIITDIQCAGKTLLEKINDLKIKGGMDEKQITLLHTLRKKGNAGTHERIAMTRDEVVAGISIINLLLEKFYNGPARQEDVMKKADHAFGEQK